MRVYVLPVGIVDVDVQTLMRWEPDRGERYEGPAAAFLIQTDDARNILVDSGLAPEHLEDSQCRVSEPLCVVNMKPEDDIRHRLREIGLRPEDVDTVVVTHLDFDHCGGHRHFPHARFVVQKEHYEHAKRHPERFPPQDWDRPELRYEQIEGEREIAPGVTLVPTPGHAPGHQSVILRGLANTGTVILSADAAHTHREFEEELLGGYPEDEQMLASMRKLKRIRDAEDATLLVCHDVDAWNGWYRISPQYYD
jgi:N-acyl homoserine lactone hydrolase